MTLAADIADRQIPDVIVAEHVVEVAADLVTDSRSATRATTTSRSSSCSASPTGISACG
jgi:hypothetical protein